VSERLRSWGAAWAVAALLPALGGGARAADDLGWSDEAEFSFVATDGNSESMSLGFKNKTVRKREKSELIFRAGGIRVESTTFGRAAIDGVVIETKTSETTAENYYANGRYEQKIHERLFWFAGGGWDRNEFAGIQNRWIVESGVGNIWHDTDDLKFKTDYGVTYTDQEDVNPNPAVEDSFLGGRFSWDYLNKLGANSTYTNTFIFDLNFDETSDWRGDMDNGLAVAMTGRLALKVGLRLLYDNEPAIEQVPNTGIGPPTVPFPLEELDTILTVSLVVRFP
jgi:putative salt-induced outer membrane protein YdiY